MIQLTPTSSTANGGSARPHGTSVPEPKLPTRCAGWSSPGLYQALELGGCRSFVPSCTRSSRGVAARPVSIGGFGSVGRGRLRRSGPPRPGTDRPAGSGKADPSLDPLHAIDGTAAPSRLI